MFEDKLKNRFLVHWSAGYDDAKQVHTLKHILENFDITHHDDVVKDLLENKTAIFSEMAEEIVFTPLD